MAVSCILRTQPVEWRTMLNENACPSILELLTSVSRNSKALESQYYISKNIQALSRNSVSAPALFQKCHANAVDILKESTLSEEELDLEDSGSECIKEAHSTSTQSCPRPKEPIVPRSSKFPEGKTIDGYSFSHNDSVISDQLPNGTCFICMSPKHFFRDCPHHHRFQTLRMANMIHVDWDLDLEKEYNREYLTMIIKSKAAATSSAYYPADMPERTLNLNERSKPAACTLHRSEITPPDCNTCCCILFEYKDKVKAMNHTVSLHLELYSGRCIVAERTLDML